MTEEERYSSQITPYVYISAYYYCVGPFTMSRPSRLESRYKRLFCPPPSPIALWSRDILPRTPIPFYFSCLFPNSTHLISFPTFTRVPFVSLALRLSVFALLTI